MYIVPAFDVGEQDIHFLGAVLIMSPTILFFLLACRRNFVSTTPRQLLHQILLKFSRYMINMYVVVKLFLNFVGVTPFKLWKGGDIRFL